jgi:5-methylcytosine-specific restriction endonuclease McrA
VRRAYDWAEIQRFYDEGNGFVACRRRFGCTAGAWNKAIRRGDLCVAATPFRDRRRRYDWSQIQAYYDEGHSYRECRDRFGFCAEAWSKAARRGDLAARGQVMPLARLLATTTSRTSVRRRLLDDGIFKNACSICGLREWRGSPLAMHLDHINGRRGDHRLENLRMLCPNCHSQTETYGGRNIGKAKPLQEPTLEV